MTHAYRISVSYTGVAENFKDVICCWESVPSSSVSTGPSLTLKEKVQILYNIGLCEPATQHHMPDGWNV